MTDYTATKPCNCRSCDPNGVPEKMNPEWKSRWVAALRSGDYIQGLLSLTTVTGPVGDRPASTRSCCLGVLAELMVTDGACEVRNLNGGDYERRYRLVGDDGFFVQTMPSEEMRAHVGLDSRASYTLSEMNDSGESSFPQIADWIEENL